MTALDTRVLFFKFKYLAIDTYTYWKKCIRANTSRDYKKYIHIYKKKLREGRTYRHHKAIIIN